MPSEHLKSTTTQFGKKGGHTTSILTDGIRKLYNYLPTAYILP